MNPWLRTTTAMPREYTSYYVECGWALDKDGNKRPLTESEHKIFARHLEASFKQMKEIANAK